ncbi:MAG: hypothetical protein SNH64_06190 [Rikenellaceae bacterium]
MRLSFHYSPFFFRRHQATLHVALVVVIDNFGDEIKIDTVSRSGN